MAKIKIEQGLEVERGDDGEFIVRFRSPGIKMGSDLSGGHLKQAKKEVFLALRSILDKAINVEEGKSGE
ncbi:MAG: hypothetical protein AAC990_04470 [Dehalococcoides mccartyi]|uniref:Uncharacterized protein n=1 Tax=Dehalococcoides mccartyi TaxID=61435 RepID=A0AB38Z7Z4_9CHLR|nr:hypothetical protein [Dehalococcoides mccartyi]WRO06680.1 hypothetical protein VLL09_04640 [Dehalococcoides mccartyi]